HFGTRKSCGFQATPSQDQSRGRPYPLDDSQFFRIWSVRIFALCGAKCKGKTAMRLLALLLVGLSVSGCVGTVSQATLEPASEANFKPRDRELLSKVPYAQATIPEPYRRHIVTYHRKESPGSIVVDSDSRFLYYVLPDGKAIRYGITVGEEALAFSGIAKVGRKAEWPTWVPTTAIKERLG